MKISYDKEADAVYISLAEETKENVWTYPCEPDKVKGMINLDFNSEGVLVGIEVLDASKKLPKEILDQAI